MSYLCYICLLAHSGVKYVLPFKRRELLTLREQLGSPPVYGGSVLLIFLVSCVALCFCVVFVFVLCHGYPMLPVSLVWLFLISPSVLSNVYSN